MSCMNWVANSGVPLIVRFLILLKDMVEENIKQILFGFVVFSHASCLESINHIFKVTQLYNDLKGDFEPFIQDYEHLGGKIYNFISYVDKNWK